MADITIGSSEAATALGYDPWGSELELWLRLTGRIPRRDPSSGTPATYRGSALEWGLIQWAARQVGAAQVMAGPGLDQQPMRHPTLYFLHSRVDGYFRMDTEPGPATVLADAKTSRYLEAEVDTPMGVLPAWGEAGTDQIPRWLKPQMLVHLACHPLAERVVVPALGTVDDDFRLYQIERDEGLIRRLEDALGRWWDLRIEQGVAPAPDGKPRTDRALDRALAAKPGRVVVATPEEAAMVRAAATKREAARAMEAASDMVRQAVKVRLGSATEFMDPDGRLLATWREGKNGRTFRWKQRNDYDEE